MSNLPLHVEFAFILQTYIKLKRLKDKLFPEPPFVQQITHSNDIFGDHYIKFPQFRNIIFHSKIERPLNVSA